MSNLAAKERKDFRNSYLTKLRNEGEIPAVVYGNNKESKPIVINGNDFARTIKKVGRNGIISLEIDGQKDDVILTDYQTNPLTNQVVHADFLFINMSTEINAQVRVTLIGNAAGVKDGGVLQQSLHDVSITAKPNEIPEAIEVDVSNLQVGETILVGDIKKNYNISINHDDDEVIASVLAPRQEDEINTGEQQDGGIPVNEEGRETEASRESESQSE